MAKNMNIAGAVLAVGVAIGGVAAIVNGAKPPVVKVKKNVPKDAKHLWVDGGVGLRDPLPTLDDGGCQAWAQRCASTKKCAKECE